jgi:predicted NodU family carbamoyl transferase
MMVVMDSHYERRDDMAAALQRFDKSARVQVVDQDLYPEFYSVLTAFNRHSPYVDGPLFAR